MSSAATPRDDMARTGGQIVVEELRAAGVSTIYCVPGESYLAVIDALYDVQSDIRLVSCRHEGGAVMMAAATAHLTGRAGVAFVTRGPGATNGSIGVHIARQASLPLVLGVGQVARRNRGRESFQEVDFETYFKPIAKAVREVSDPADIGAAVAEAVDLAESGRQGPVVLAFPEDVLSEVAAAQSSARVTTPASDLPPGHWSDVARLMESAVRPVAIVGGGPWSDSACHAIEVFSERLRLPVFSAFRRADCFDNHHSGYAGFLGLATAASAWERLAESDCVLAIGTRLDEPTTRDYEFPRADQTVIHIHPDASQIGLNVGVDAGIVASVETAAAALAALSLEPQHDWSSWRDRVRNDFIASEAPPVSTGALDLGAVMSILNDAVPANSIVTTDAGNFTAWPLRYRRYARPGRLLAPVNGAMGYGVPSAVAASLQYPERTVIGCVGDGGMLMTGMELATALQYGASPVILVFNNNKYGTIDMHQQRHYPGRDYGNALVNPDFAALAQSFGAFGVQVRRTDEFADALAGALASGRAAVIELVMDAP